MAAGVDARMGVGVGVGLVGEGGGGAEESMVGLRAETGR